MGLKDLIDGEDNENSARHRKYERHEREDQLNEWVEELQGRFPWDVPVEFVEVSTRMEKNAAKTYHKGTGENATHYIRVAESTLETEEEMIKQYLLSCMVTIYFKDLGFDEVTTNSSIHKWVAGAVGCRINAVQTNSEEWREAAVPFLTDDMVADHMIM